VILKDSSCKKCGSKWVENKTHSLCHDCNYFRLHRETELQAKIRKENSKPVQTYKVKKKHVKMGNSTAEKRKLVIGKDHETYLKVFQSNPNECEECGDSLPEEFKDAWGNIIAIWQFSHIMTKGAYPEYRHNPKNFNRLCQKHHHQWEFGDREKMKIFLPNQERINQIKNGTV